MKGGETYGKKILKEAYLYGRDLIYWTISGIGIATGGVIVSKVINKFTSKKEEA